MGVTCQILINKTREGVYKPGDAVTGVVKYAIDEPTEYKDVTFSFLGRGRCSWSEEDSNNKSSTTYTGTEDYIVTHVNITNKRPETHIKLHGAYEYPFEFYIPDDVPSSFKDRIGSITYILRLKFVKSNLFSFNKVFTAYIPVYGAVDLLNSDGQPTPEGPIVFGLEKSIFALFSTKKPIVTLKAQINKCRLMPGENVHLSCTVTNCSNVTVTGLRAELFCYMTYTADCGRTNKHNLKVKHCEAIMPEVSIGQMRTYACIVPTLAECYSIQHSRVVRKEYKVRVTVRLPVPHVNATVEVPVVIGERKGVALDPCTEAVEDSQANPPSYWEVVCKTEDDWDVVKKVS